MLFLGSIDLISLRKWAPTAPRGRRRSAGIEETMLAHAFEGKRNLGSLALRLADAFARIRLL